MKDKTSSDTTIDQLCRVLLGSRSHVKGGSVALLFKERDLEIIDIINRNQREIERRSGFHLVCYKKGGKPIETHTISGESVELIRYC